MSPSVINNYVHIPECPLLFYLIKDQKVWCNFSLIFASTKNFYMWSVPFFSYLPVLFRNVFTLKMRQSNILKQIFFCQDIPGIPIQWRDPFEEIVQKIYHSLLFSAYYACGTFYDLAQCPLAFDTCIYVNSKSNQLYKPSFFISWYGC